MWRHFLLHNVKVFVLLRMSLIQWKHHIESGIEPSQGSRLPRQHVTEFVRIYLLRLRQCLQSRKKFIKLRLCNTNRYKIKQPWSAIRLILSGKWQRTNRICCSCLYENNWFSNLYKPIASFLPAFWNVCAMIKIQAYTDWAKYYQDLVFLENRTLQFTTHHCPIKIQQFLGPSLWQLHVRHSDRDDL